MKSPLNQFQLFMALQLSFGLVSSLMYTVFIATFQFHSIVLKKSYKFVHCNQTVQHFNRSQLFIFHSKSRILDADQKSKNTSSDQRDVGDSDLIELNNSITCIQKMRCIPIHVKIRVTDRQNKTQTKTHVCV